MIDLADVCKASILKIRKPRILLNRKDGKDRILSVYNSCKGIFKERLFIFNKEKREPFLKSINTGFVVLFFHFESLTLS